jgi:Domain of unknown function (DUF397)
MTRTTTRATALVRWWQTSRQMTTPPKGKTVMTTRWQAASGCVEVARGDGTLMIRDSKQDDGPVMKCTPEP